MPITLSMIISLKRGFMKIYIDADACPRVIKDMIERAALRLQIEALFVANQFLRLPVSPYLRGIQVGEGADVADDYIAEHCEAGDLVVTADIPLAARVVERGAIGLDPRGTIYDTSNMASILSTRNFMQELRDSGVQTGGPSAFGPKEKQAFASSLDKMLHKLKNH